MKAKNLNVKKKLMTTVYLELNYLICVLLIATTT